MPLRNLVKQNAVNEAAEAKTVEHRADETVQPANEKVSKS